MSEEHEPGSLDEAIPGQRLTTAQGTVYRVRRDYPVGHHYGGWPLEQARGVPGSTLAALARDDGLSSLTLDQVCFLDTETTGLAGGTGTYVFLVGVGSFSGDFFRVDQFFMEDFDQEPALIATLAEFLEGFRGVVSFNGKAFDLPLLETRFILSRRRSPLGGRPHLDLLASARRLWGARLESCRLVALEEAILGETRVGDIPGYLVPEFYFRYLRTKDPEIVRPIFEHNRQDVLSLLALAGRAAHRYEAFLEDPPRESGVPSLDLFGLARLYSALGRHEPSVRCYLACLDAGPPDHIEARAGLECVRSLRRLGRTPEAIRLCEKLADGPPHRLWALVELAKELEHRARDYERALSVVDRALGLLDTGGAIPPALASALLWRRGRLEGKLEAFSASRSRFAAGRAPGTR